MGLAANAYCDATNSRYEYINADFSTLYQQLDGTHIWSTAASGSADNAITFSEVMKINATGAVTKPLQPAFCVNPSAVQYNNAVGSTVTITLDNERFDNNADFASNTFTAPVTGRYQFQAMMRYDDPDRDADYHQLILNTSNQVYVTTYDLGPLASDPNYWMFYINVTVDMDASDTAYLQFYQYGGAATTDITTGGFFSGYLVA